MEVGCGGGSFFRLRSQVSLFVSAQSAAAGRCLPFSHSPFSHSYSPQAVRTFLTFPAIPFHAPRIPVQTFLRFPADAFPVNPLNSLCCGMRLRLRGWMWILDGDAGCRRDADWDGGTGMRIRIRRLSDADRQTLRREETGCNDGGGDSQWSRQFHCLQLEVHAP